MGAFHWKLTIAVINLLKISSKLFNYIFGFVGFGVSCHSEIEISIDWLCVWVFVWEKRAIVNGSQIIWGRCHCKGLQLFQPWVHMEWCAIEPFIMNVNKMKRISTVESIYSSISTFLLAGKLNTNKKITTFLTNIQKLCGNCAVGICTPQNQFLSILYTVWKVLLNWF